MKKSQLFLLFAAAAFLVAAGLGCSARAKKTYHLERANQWFDAGQYAKAEVEYLNVLRADPQNAEVYGKLGIIYFNEGRFQQAAPFLFKGSQLQETNMEVRLKLGDIYLGIGELTNANAEAEYVLENNPQDPEAPVLFAQSIATRQEITAEQRRLTTLAQNNASPALETGLGILAARESDFETALNDFHHALALDSHFAAAYVALANLYWQRNELKKAEAAYKAAADCAQPRSILQLQYGQFEIQTGNFTTAQNFFSDLTTRLPDYVPGWLGLAEVALDQKQFDDCSSALKKALALDSDNIDAQVLDARLDLADAKTASATEKLERLAKLYPQAPRIHYQLALAYVIGNRTDKALNQLREATALNPDFFDAAFLLAQLELKSGDTDSAIDLLKQLVARRPGWVETKLILADAYRLQKDFSNALQIYLQLEKSFPQNPQFPLLAGSTFVQQQNEAAARQEFNRVLEIQPDNITAQEELSQLDMSDGQFAAAQKRVEKIISQNPQQAQPQILEARIFLEQGQTNQAEAVLSKASGLSGGLIANFLLAQLYFNSGQDQKALDSLDIVLQKTPHDISTLMLAGAIQTDRNNYPEAASAYEKLLATNPQYGPALNNLAWLYSDKLGNLNKAYDLAQRAHQLLPTDPSTADTLGWVLFKKADYSSALKLFQDSAAKLSDNPEAQYHLAMTYYMLANEEGSRGAFQSALGSNQDFPDRGECQDRLNILNTDPSMADAATRAMLEKRISEDPNDPFVFARLAAIYQRENNSDKAISLCQTVLKASPSNFKADILLAELYAPTDPQKAYQLAQAAYQLRPDNAEVCATLGRLALQNGNDQWAYSLLQNASQGQPDNSRILFDFANAAFCVGKISEAQTAMQNAVQMGLPAPLSTKAGDFLDLIGFYENPSQAIAQKTRVEEILGSDPDNVPALLVDAMIESQDSNPIGAERAYEKLLSRHPNCALAQKNLAILYAQNLVEPEKAYPVALKAREEFPDDPQVANALAQILFQKGDYVRAADIFNTISDSTSADAQLFYCLGISEFHLKNYLESKSSLQRALDMHLSGQEATDARETLAELK